MKVASFPIILNLIFTWDSYPAVLGGVKPVSRAEHLVKKRGIPGSKELKITST